MILSPVLDEVMDTVTRAVDLPVGPHPPLGYVWLEDQYGIYITDQYGEYIAVPE